MYVNSRKLHHTRGIKAESKMPSALEACTLYLYFGRFSISEMLKRPKWRSDANTEIMARLSFLPISVKWLSNLNERCQQFGILLGSILASSFYQIHFHYMHLNCVFYG